MNPARLVEVATSGADMTRYGARAWSRDRLTRVRPNTSWVETGLLLVVPVEAGTATGAAGVRGSRCRASRRWLHKIPGAVEASNRSHSVAGVRPSPVRNSSICWVVSRAEWLRGLPAIGRPQPLTV